MTKKPNILILSCGTRNKIVQYFKRALSGAGLVLAADCSCLAPALYDADKHFIIPGMDAPDYIETLLALCRQEQVGAVLTLIDPELSVLAKHKRDFLAIGTVPLVCDYAVTELCLDKFAMFGFLRESGFPAVPSYMDRDRLYRDLALGALTFPLFVKPVRGSGSNGIGRVQTRASLNALLDSQKDLMVQPCMTGEEYDADVYIDFITGEPAAIFTKQKLIMRAGETTKSVSVKDPALFALIERFVKQAGLRGVIDIDFFKVNGQYFISEVNPRFGGSYPHAYECGVDIPSMILRNLRGEPNPGCVGAYDDGIYIMNYSEFKASRCQA